MNAYRARVFIVSFLQSRKLPKIALDVIWQSAATKDASARDRTLKYSDRYDPM